MQTLTWHTRASLAALCAMLTLPFLNPHHFHPIPTFYPEWTAAACALLAATLLLQYNDLSTNDILTRDEIFLAKKNAKK